MTPPVPVQLTLFGPQPVHIAARSPATGLDVCAECKASLALAGAWDRWDGCHDCPGWVEPVPRWMTLGDALAMHAPAELDEPGLPLEEAEAA